jgi:predicted transcriptional regulator
MNLHIYLEQDIFNQLDFLCKKTHKKRNTVIREAIRYYLIHQQKSSWSKDILDFKGIEDFEAFEDTRHLLSPLNSQSFLD